jgi:hypothetical protein
VSDRLALAALAGAVSGIGRELGADRCWLYVRDPERGEGIALVRWLRSDGVADVPAELHAWTPEAADLAQTDPLFARALAGAAADVVDDTRAAGVNRALEDALGHRAFVHLNLHREGRLVGVLQPGMVGAPRAWTETGALVALAPALAELTAAAVRGPRPASLRLVG